VLIAVALTVLMQLTQTAPSPSAGLTAYVVTFGPGDEPWEKFGHNMIIIQGSAGAVAYNWGMFEFDSGFFGRFMQGRLMYWMGMDIEADRVMHYYMKKLDRTTQVQELNLSPAQVNALWGFCRINELPENRQYRYDYFWDNCSTRVRDAIDHAVGGQIKRRATGLPSHRTFRSESLRLTAGDWWLCIGLDFVLGHPTDRRLTAWDEMFVPMLMHDRFNEMTIIDEAGRTVPLVRSDQLEHTSARKAPRDTPPMWAGWFGLVGVVLGTIMGRGGCACAKGQAACGLAQPSNDRTRTKKSEKDAKPQAESDPTGPSNGRWVKWTFIFATMFWLILSSFGSWVLVYFWFLTDHAAVRPNENLLQLSPLCLPMVLLVPLMLRGKRLPGRISLVLGLLILSASLLGLLLKLLPMMNQPNWNMIALALPANAGLAWAVWRSHQFAGKAAVPAATLSNTGG
jgi:hypothetical protein